MRLAAFVLWCCLIAAPAFAQSPYVVGSIGLELSRSSRVESSGFESPDAGGEAFGGSLRVGTSLGDRWGVELEFARAAAIEDETTLGTRGLPTPFTLTTAVGAPPTLGTLTPIVLNFSARVRQQHSTVGTVAWIRQRAGGAVDLVYLGGVAFTRSVTEQETSFALSLPSLPPGFAPSSQVSRATFYNAGPIVGMEARIALTGHVRLVPSVRLQGLGGESNGWLVRAGVGLGWFF